MKKKYVIAYNYRTSSDAVVTATSKKEAKAILSEILPEANIEYVRELNDRNT